MRRKLSKVELEEVKKAQDLAKNNDWRSALEIIKKLILKNNKSELIHIIMANIYWNIDELENAIEHYKKAIGINPMSERASLGLYHCYDDLGRDNEALEEMRRYMEIADSEDYRAIMEEINDASN